MRPANTDALITLLSVQAHDYAFTIEAADAVWDVYRFNKQGKRGTLAFARLDDGTWVIGVLRAGELDEEQVRRAILEGKN